MDLSYDNLGGTNMQNGAGDIILAPSVDSRKAKKKWIIIAAALVAVVIISLLIWLIASGRLLGDKGFNEYKNLVLYGDNSEIEYPTEDGLYAIQVAYIGDNAEYFNEVISKEEKISKSKKEMYKVPIDIISLWMRANLLYNHNDDTIAVIYERDGYDAALSYIEDANRTYIESNDEGVSREGVLLMDAEEKYLNYVDAYESNGCKITEQREDCSYRSYEIDSRIYIDMSEAVLLAFNYSRSLLDRAVMELEMAK